MKKFFILICPLLLICCLLFGACRNSNAVYSIYANGEYENTLSKDNRYLLSDSDRVKENINMNDGLLLVLIGAPWCPYCANDIGPIDERFKKSPLLSETCNIFYIDVVDSQNSTETIMDLNRVYGWNIRARLPCLMAIRDGALAAVITEEQFSKYKDRTERIDAFFCFLENM